MKIYFSNVISYNNSLIHNRYNNSQNSSTYRTKQTFVPKNTISFKQAKIPPEAIQYLNLRKIELKKLHNCANPEALKFFDAERLEGIQNGIKIFEGLSFPKIAYMISILKQIIVYRGCNNRCIHCYAEAQTPFYMRINDFISKIPFEDFENLINGFGELNKRLGFNVFKNTPKNFMALFHDADCSTIYLQDKNGKIYDYADLSKMVHDVTGKAVLFDTAGWNIKDKLTQKRMEDLVQKIVTSNEYDFMQFYISINPFHSIMNKSFELKKKSDIEKSQKLKEIYTDRMANAIYTFLPLFDKKNFITDESLCHFIIRGLVNVDISDAKSLYDYSIRNTWDICRNIHKKLYEMLTEDLMSACPKIVKNESQKRRYLDLVKEFFSYSIAHLEGADISVTNKRLIEKMGKNTFDKYYKKISDRLYNSAEHGKYLKGGLINVNGHFYTTNDIETYSTNINLNYSSKWKPSAPIEPNLRDEIIQI